MQAALENRTLYLQLQFDAQGMFVPEAQRNDDVRAMYQAATALKGRFLPVVGDDNRLMLVNAFAKAGYLLWAYEQRANRESVRFVMDEPVNERVIEICGKLDPRNSRISIAGPICLPQ